MRRRWHAPTAEPGPPQSPVEFANPLDWVGYELWHHEGRRARHGASMMGPDYTHGHGTYEVAKHFYSKMIPDLEHLIKMDPQEQEERERRQREFQQRYHP